MEISSEEQDEQARAYGRILAKAWNDVTFMRRLLADPAAALAAEGMTVVPEVELRVVQNSDTLVYLPLPARPAAELREWLSTRLAELSDVQLEAIAGGALPGIEGLRVWERGANGSGLIMP